MTTESDVIDLTDSFTLIDHYQLADIIIELDDSIHNSPMHTRRQPRSSNDEIGLTQAQIQQRSLLTTSSRACEKVSKGGFGDCPICWDELGKSRLASTKCGHVFCLQCIQKVVLQTKRCPTCRCVLKGSSAYHPLYLP